MNISQPCVLNFVLLDAAIMGKKKKMSVHFQNGMASGCSFSVVVKSKKNQQQQQVISGVMVYLYEK